MDTLVRRQIFLDKFLEFPIRSGGWAISEDALYDVIQYTLFAQPKLILDLGSGTSTIAFARYAQKMSQDQGVPIKVISVDSDEVWLEDTRKILSQLGLEEYVTLIHARIEDGEFGLYYKISDIAGYLSGKKIDLLFVDGPMGRLQTKKGEKIYKQRRYPAKYFIEHFGSKDIAIFLDDTKREDEKAISEMWAEELDLNLEFRDYEKGLSVLHKKNSTKAKFLIPNHLGVIDTEVSAKQGISVNDELINIKGLVNKSLKTLHNQHERISEKELDIKKLELELDESRKALLGKERHEGELVWEVDNLKRHLNLLENSSFWKLRTHYLHYKRAFFDFLKNPSLIITFTKKRLIKLRKKFGRDDVLEVQGDNPVNKNAFPYSINMVGDGNFYEHKSLGKRKIEKVEIILIRYNNKVVEDRAIECVKKNTKYPYKLTIFDNYENNEGLSTVWNRLISKSECKYICLLNSDAFVTSGWLDEIMKGFSYSDKVLAISPSSNNAKGQISQIGQKKKNTFLEMKTLSGFCLVIKNNLEFNFPESIPFYGGEHAWCIDARRRGGKLLWSQGAWVEHLEASSANKENNFDALWKDRNSQLFSWLAETTPVLFTTHNRLDHTKKTLPALMESSCGKIIVVDNASTDGTVEYLKKLEKRDRVEVVYNNENLGIGGAMNVFLKKFPNEEYVAKVDNDTLVSPDWLYGLISSCERHLLDAVQAKHHIISTEFETFDEWMASLSKCSEDTYLSEFIGGSGIVIRRNSIRGSLPGESWVLGGWNTYQAENPQLKTAFCTSVFIELLDMIEDNQTYYDDNVEYYKLTGRI